jgi:hypothetical protein
VFAKLHKEASPRLMLQNAVSHLARSEAPQRNGVNAFDHVPSGPLPAPQNLPEPAAGKVVPPEGHGVVPNIPQSNPLPPISGNSPLKLPAIQAPVETKN